MLTTDAINDFKDFIDNIIAYAFSTHAFTEGDLNASDIRPLTDFSTHAFTEGDCKFK